MKKFILWFFAVLGFIFFWIIVGVIYFVVADPFNLRPLVNMMWQASESVPEFVTPTDSDTQLNTSPTDQSAVESSQTPANAPETTSGPNAAQTKALDSVGIDSTAAMSITPDQEACFVDVLGQARVNQVKAGAVPTAGEFFSARGCI